MSGRELTYEVFWLRGPRLWFFIVRRQPTWQQAERGELGEGIAIGWRKQEMLARDAARAFIEGVKRGG